jgi:hypothetical protein
MELNQLLFWIWCMGIHCLLWALIDASTRNGMVFAYGKLRYKVGNLINKV